MIKTANRTWDRRLGVLACLSATLCIATSCSRFHRTSDVLEAPADTALTCREGTAGVNVQWIDASEDDSDRARNGARCRTVGRWVVEDFRSASHTPSLDSLIIVTWNTYIGGGDIVQFGEALRRGDFTGGKPPDDFVVLLQEVYRTDPDIPKDMPEGVFIPPRRDYVPPSGERIDILESARRLGLWLCYIPSMRNGKPDSWPAQEDRGNAILATMPLSELTAIVLPFEKYRRVAIAGTIEGVSSRGEPWRLRICNVHLDNRAQFPRFLQSAGTGRLRQIKPVVRAITEVPAVLGGDFNTWAPEALETALPHVRKTFRQPEKLGEEATVVAPFVPDRRVDYLFFNLPEGLTGRYERIDNRYGSDHYPLLGWVQLVPQ